jgi:hypothetical protein
MISNLNQLRIVRHFKKHPLFYFILVGFFLPLVTLISMIIYHGEWDNFRKMQKREAERVREERKQTAKEAGETKFIDDLSTRSDSIVSRGNNVIFYKDGKIIGGHINGPCTSTNPDSISVKKAP